MSVRPAKTLIRLVIRPVWSESSLCAHWVAKDPRFLHADGEDSDQIGRMPRLIWVFAGRTVTFLVLSCGGSFHVFFCLLQLFDTLWSLLHYLSEMFMMCNQRHICYTNSALQKYTFLSVLHRNILTQNPQQHFIHQNTKRFAFKEGQNRREKK